MPNYKAEPSYAIEEIQVTGAPTQRELKKEARKKKRLKLAEIRTYKRIADAEKRLQTIEQKREGYSRGGPAKSN
jgi:hypothetical protein